MPVPCVYLGNAPDHTEFSYVITDNERGGYLATRSLIQKGYNKIGFISGSDGESLIDERFTGYKSAMKKYNIPINDKYIVLKSWRKSSGYETICKMIDYGRYPNAIIAGNDLLAMGILQGIKEKGLRVPEDIAVIGFDDIPNASWPEINLSTIRQPKIKMGEIAVELIFELMKNDDKQSNPTARRIILNPELILRGTC